MNNKLDPGRLSRRMALEIPNDVDDGAGGAVRSWEKADEFWAELKPVSARNFVADGSAVQRVTHELYFRTGPQLTTEKRLRFGARLFRILHVRDANETGARQLALIEEVKP